MHTCSTSSYSCDTCGFELYVPVADLAVSVLGLYDDARFQGRCLLVLRDHFDDLLEVPSPVAEEFLMDVQRAARAIRMVTGAPRLNYALLGNVEPHVHWHLFPRELANDPLPGRPPWEADQQVARLDAPRRNQLVGGLRAAIG